MQRVQHLYQTSVGRKVTMAVSGIVLFGFVLVHMVGNLKVYTGESHFNDYAVFLRTVGEPALPHGAVLWIARIVLLACVGIHIVAAALVWWQSRNARIDDYHKQTDLSFSYASRTMRWGGVIVVVFVVYHLLHLTVGVAHPDFAGAGHPQAWEGHVNAYRNLVTGFRVPWVAAAYVLAMVPLGLHIYHGVWSATQTLSLAGPRVSMWRRPVAAAVAGVVVTGNVSIPVAVLAGWVG
jgi:succinate dehydrogenase / fumarate reductase cytochrome b subunit